MLTVFDLDGTLIDNELAVREAYALAGVDMPADAWGKPVGAWCTEEQHAKKQQVYASCLRIFGAVGPAYTFWISAPLSGCHILTGASEKSAKESLEFLGISAARLSGHGMSLREKIFWIKGAMTRQDVLYVDCDSKVVLEIQEKTSCFCRIPL